MPMAAQAWTNFELVEAEDGAAWVADGPSARVERLEKPADDVTTVAFRFDAAGAGESECFGARRTIYHQAGAGQDSVAVRVDDTRIDPW